MRSIQPISPIQEQPASPERPLLDTAHVETESTVGVEFSDDMSVVMSDDSVAPEERLKQLGIKLPTPVEQYWAKCVGLLLQQHTMSAMC
jgi:hypothetical protein